ncbi:MAG TPA: vWA domain-containing protein [Polyangia bacterium]|jgi:hypothetical protein|nr:vWA domain-containing protein [Polyangia bacterium]
MTPRTGAGGAAVLLAALFPAACLQTKVLPPPPGQTSSGAGGGGGVVSGGGGTSGTGGAFVGGVGGAGGDSDGGQCPNGPGSPLRLTHSSPTVIFAVDHSASMMTTRLPPNNSNRLEVVQAVIKELLPFSDRANFGYLEFPQFDRRGFCSMNSCCVTNVFLNSPSSIRDAIDRCANAGPGCLSQMDANNTPTVPALNQVNDLFRTLDLRDPQKIVLLLTDHEPASCGSSSDPCDEAAQVINKLDNTLNVLTYVVVVGDSVQNDNGASACLNLMAGASGARRPGPLAYYSAVNEGQVRQAMNDPVMSSICSAQVEDTFADASRVVVDIDSQPIPRDPTNTDGWNFTRLTNGRQAIVFYGEARKKFLNATDSTQIQKVHATVCPH